MIILKVVEDFIHGCDLIRHKDLTGTMNYELLCYYCYVAELI